MAAQSLVFQETTLHPVCHQNTFWLTINDLASCLYKRVHQNDAPLPKQISVVNTLYQRHAAEFTPSMTRLLPIQTKGGTQEVRVFSLRGAHLLAMFARTPVAAEFRRWALDILDREASSPALPDTERMKTAVAFALEASKLAAQTVIEAFLKGEEPRRHERYLLTMQWDHRERAFDRAHVQTIDHKAYIASLPRLAKIIGDPGFMGDSGELAGLAQACVKELDSRLANYREARAIRAKQEAR
jgi:prophage antirepressor-like protein